MKCPICGHKSSLKESICPNCGYRFNDQEIIEEQEKEPVSKKTYNTYRKVRFIRNLIAFIIIVCTGIPVMFNAFKSNINNHINNYGTYTIEEFEEMNIKANTVNLLKYYKDAYDQYLLDYDFKITITPTIYYLSSGTTSSLHYLIQYDDSAMYYDLELQFSDTTVENVELRLSHSYKGNLGESIQYIKKDDLKILEELIKFENIYSLFEETFNKIEVTDKEFVSVYTDHIHYYVKVHEQKYDDLITFDYTIKKK